MWQIKFLQRRPLFGALRYRKHLQSDENNVPATHGSFNTSANKKKTNEKCTNTVAHRCSRKQCNRIYSILFELWIAFCVKLFIVISVNAWGFAAFRPNKWPILFSWWIAELWMHWLPFIHWISTQFRMKYACRKTISGFDLFHSDMCRYLLNNASRDISPIYSFDGWHIALLLTLMRSSWWKENAFNWLGRPSVVTDIHFIYFFRSFWIVINFHATKFSAWVFSLFFFLAIQVFNWANIFERFCMDFFFFRFA